MPEFNFAQWLVTMLGVAIGIVLAISFDEWWKKRNINPYEVTEGDVERAWNASREAALREAAGVCKGRACEPWEIAEEIESMIKEPT